MKIKMASFALFASVLAAPIVDASEFQSIADAYGAQKAGTVVTQPKIKPDGKTYHLHGRIELPVEGEGVFLAKLTPSQEIEALYDAVQRSRGDYSVSYFYVVMPEKIADYYYENASVGEGFDLIGRYESNHRYLTVAGQEKIAVVFVADYLKLWSESTAVHLKNTHLARSLYSPQYYSCIERVSVNLLETIDCMSAELESQNARLAQAYSRSSIPEKDYADWIKIRDKKCRTEEEPEYRGELIAMIECELEMTALKVNEIQAL